jgi:hypothetical protein
MSDGFESGAELCVTGAMVSFVVCFRKSFTLVIAPSPLKMNLIAVTFCSPIQTLAKPFAPVVGAVILTARLLIGVQLTTKVLLEFARFKTPILTTSTGKSNANVMTPPVGF